MSQAKTLTEKELRKVLNFVALRKHATRNKTMLLVTHWAGMRVGEVAALRIGDVLAADGTIKSEMRLLAEQTKGNHSRTVFLPEKLRKELLAYLQHRFNTKQLVAVTYMDAMQKPLFNTQKREGFNANTLCQHFHWLYKQAGVEGASSHSGRRSFITGLANKGIGARTLMALAGHRSLAVTQKYIDVNDEMLRKAVELV